MKRALSKPYVKKIDALQIPVPDLDIDLAFYRDRLGHELVWRSETAAGLRMPDTDAEMVLQTEREGLEINLLVESADAASGAIEGAGGKVVEPPFDIRIGRCAVVEDPWGNRLVILDMSRGALLTDEEGHIVGNEEH